MGSIRRGLQAQNLAIGYSVELLETDTEGITITRSMAAALTSLAMTTSSGEVRTFTATSEATTMDTFQDGNAPADDDDDDNTPLIAGAAVGGVLVLFVAGYVFNRQRRTTTTTTAGSKAAITAELTTFTNVANPMGTTNKPQSGPGDHQRQLSNS